MIECGATIRYSYALGSVTGKNLVGGLVGQHYDGNISDSYSRATVNGNGSVGGLVGGIYAGGRIYRSYSTGAVACTAVCGGLVVAEESGSTVTNSYWDTQTSGQAASPGGGIGRTTAQMQQQATYQNYNFYKLWRIDEGISYPMFQDLSGYASPKPVNLADLGGSGTPADPYRLTNADELNAMRQGLAASFRLTKDIDLSASVIWNAGLGWAPVGDAGSPFTGTFDGGGYVIRYLAVNRPTTTHQGLFGQIDHASIKRVGVENVNAQGGPYLGGLVGAASFSTIEEASVTGQIISPWSNYAFDSYAGGLIGVLHGGSLNRANSSASVSGVSKTGGLVGITNVGATIRHAYVLGSVTGANLIGGLVGQHYNGEISDCYSRASVNGNDAVGGLVGGIYAVSSINRSYSTGAVACTADCGGLVIAEESGSTVTDSYWDTQTSGQAASPGGGSGRTTVEMTYPYATNTYVGWDFVETWMADLHHTNNGYPYLGRFCWECLPNRGGWRAILER
jgi:hypothetical protein